MYRFNHRCSCARCKAHSMMWPAILITVGVLFLLQTFGGWRFDFWDHTWPLVLIVIGGVILAKQHASIDGHIDPAQEYVVLQQPVIVQNPAAIVPAGSQGNTEVHNG